MDASLGKSRFSRIFPLIAYEQLARVEWSRPNDLRVQMVARRSRTLTAAIGADLDFDSPWFFPRGVGDSIQLFDAELPERAALHPLAPGADAYYRYAIVDSSTVRLPGRSLEVATLDVRPRRSGAALMAGRLSVDRTTGEVVRLTFLFLGDQLWVSPEDSTHRDSVRAARANRMANQALRVEADIEYALFEERYWMPFRQLVTIEAQDHWITGAVIPVRMVTDFRDYEINTGRPVTFQVTLPDTVDSETVGNWNGDSGRVVRTQRGGGSRWEMERPPRAELDNYRGWEDSLTLDARPGDERRLKEMGEELGRLAEDLPAGMTGRGGPGFVRWGETLRFNRVQGLSVGGTWHVDPHVPFTSVFVSGRFGFSDQRILGGVAARRDAPGGVWELSVSRALRDVDPFSNGTSMANSMNALFTGHDDADYLLATGARLAYSRRVGRRWEWTARLGFERHDDVATEAESKLHDFFFGDGRFQPNPPVREGAWTVAGMTLDRIGTLGSLRIGADGIGDRRLAGARAWTEVRLVAGPVRATATGGAASRADLPQILMRAGGLRTVRGYDFGTRSGQAMWAVQLEATLLRRGVLRPFLFADVGNAGPLESVFRGAPLIGAGGGLSMLLLVTEFRLEVSKSVGAFDAGKVRVDLVFRPAR